MQRWAKLTALIHFSLAGVGGDAVFAFFLRGTDGEKVKSWQF
jgi:hypothetical protein